MDDIVKLFRSYRFASSIDERTRLGETLLGLVQRDLRLFVLASVPSSASADDVSQEILIAIAVGLIRFKGDTKGEFWAWAYGIARNKLADHFRRNATESERFQPMPPEELWPLVEASAAACPLSTGERLDLEYVMKLLADANPECAAYLWRHYVLGLDYGEIAEEQNLGYDNVRMRIGRCLQEARSLVA